jgi:hypothetical protein
MTELMNEIVVVGRFDSVASFCHEEAVASILLTSWLSVISTMVDAQQRCFRRSTRAELFFLC